MDVHRPNNNATSNDVPADELPHGVASPPDSGATADKEAVAADSDAIRDVDLTGENSQADRAKTIVEDAVAELKRIEGDLSFAEEERQKKLSVFLSRVYVASMLGKPDESLHRSLVAESGIRKQKNTPHHKLTLRAILKMADVKIEKQTEHEYYLVIDGLDCAGVPQQEEAVHDFLVASETVEGKTVSGFSRAKAHRSKKKLAIAADDQPKRQQKDTAHAAAYREIIERVKQKPIGIIDVEQPKEVEEDVWLSVNRGRDMLIKLKMSPGALQSLIVSHAGTE